MGDRKSSARPAGDPSPRRKALRAVGIAAAAVVFGAGLYQIYGWIVQGIGWYRMNRGAVHTMLIATAVAALISAVVIWRLRVARAGRAGGSAAGVSALVTSSAERGATHHGGPAAATGAASAGAAGAAPRTTAAAGAAAAGAAASAAPDAARPRGAGEAPVRSADMSGDDFARRMAELDALEREL